MAKIRGLPIFYLDKGQHPGCGVGHDEVDFAEFAAVVSCEGREACCFKVVFCKLLKVLALAQAR
jgi:hypothetical protein